MSEEGKKLTVLVCGCTGCGKTTVAEAIRRALAESSIEAIVVDIEGGRQDDETHMKALQSLALDGLSVEIGVMQANRHGTICSLTRKQRQK